MQSILTRMVYFECRICQERFAAFHPTFEPDVDLEMLRLCGDGLPVCDVGVALWEELPPAPGCPESELLVAARCSGTCRRCHRDVVAEQARQQYGVCGGDVISKRSFLNNMDLCFGCPWDDLKALFAEATVPEAMLVALDHMQARLL